MNVESVVSIVIICYLAGIGAKQIKTINDSWIPFIVGVLGGVLGAVGMFVIPDYPAKDILNAISVGIVSGMASTGANQIVKQVQK